MRKPFDHGLDEPFIIDLHGESVDRSRCAVFARNLLPLAKITDEVLKTPGGRFIRFTVAAAEENPREIGRYRGWYVAAWIEQGAAEVLRASWAVLEEQPAQAPRPGRR